MFERGHAVGWDGDLAVLDTVHGWGGGRRGKRGRPSGSMVVVLVISMSGEGFGGGNEVDDCDGVDVSGVSKDGRLGVISRSSSSGRGTVSAMS